MPILHFDMTGVAKPIYPYKIIITVRYNLLQAKCAAEYIKVFFQPRGGYPPGFKPSWCGILPTHYNPGERMCRWGFALF